MKSIGVSDACDQSANTYDVSLMQESRDQRTQRVNNIANGTQQPFEAFTPNGSIRVPPLANDYRRKLKIGSRAG